MLTKLEKEIIIEWLEFHNEMLGESADSEYFLKDTKENRDFLKNSLGFSDEELKRNIQMVNGGISVGSGQIIAFLIKRLGTGL